MKTRGLRNRSRPKKGKGPRLASENGSLGTDHGHGSVLIVRAGQVNCGKVHGEWPGLRAAEWIEPGDLAIPSDDRDVWSEIFVMRLHDPARAEISQTINPGWPIFCGIDHGTVLPRR